MIKPFLLAAALILSYPSQDVHVATWSTGTPDSDSYESLSFWVKENHRAYIRYTHGKDADAVNLSWIGPDSLPGQRGFRISPPQSGIGDLHVIPQGNDLHVFDGSNHYDKSFRWENENDTAASCSICAQNDKQAIGWLRRYFF
jgi:hypothetical protein